MRVIVIGGSGHIGTYLTPRLVEEGHHVISVSRSQRQPYLSHTAWREVEVRTIDRAADNFGSFIRGLGPDVVIDLICYTLDSAQQLVEALKGQVRQFLHCGTVWIHGPAVEVPVTEDQPRRPITAFAKPLLKNICLASFTTTASRRRFSIRGIWLELDGRR